MSPKPGPTFDIDVAAADIDVVKSKPLVDKRAVITKKITIKLSAKYMEIMEEYLLNILFLRHLEITN